MREAQDRKACEEVFEEMLDFVEREKRGGGTGAKEAQDTLLAFHRLAVPATLNSTFLSTNLIENVLRNWREATDNVKRWNEKTDMVSRWMATGLLWAETGFRKVRGHEDLPLLAAALALCPSSSAPAEAGASCYVSSASAEPQEACTLSKH